MTKISSSYATLQATFIIKQALNLIGVIVIVLLTIRKVTYFLNKILIFLVEFGQSFLLL